MYKVDRYDVKIVVALGCGVYVFDNESATGKTRLCNLLKKYRAFGEPVAAYTYDDMLIDIPITNVLVPGKFQLIMLDRYDMYAGNEDLIQACGENAIVLIDCKGDSPIIKNSEWCMIEMTPNSIEVVQ